MSKEKLRNLLIEATKPDSVFRPRDGKTFCNQAFMFIAKEMGCTDPKFNKDKDSANIIWEKITASNSWRKAAPEAAAIHADSGGLAVAMKKYDKHGHIACLFPTDVMEEAGHWGHKVPILANVGEKMGILATNQCFAVALGEPDYYIYKEA